MVYSAKRTKKIYYDYVKKIKNKNAILLIILSSSWNLFVGHQKKSNSQKKRFNMEAESVPLIHLAPFFIMLSCYCEELYLTQSVIFFKRKHKQKLSQTAGSWVTAVIYVTGTHSWFLHCTQHAISPLIVLK